MTHTKLLLSLLDFVVDITLFNLYVVEIKCIMLSCLNVLSHNIKLVCN